MPERSRNRRESALPTGKSTVPRPLPIVNTVFTLCRHVVVMTAKDRGTGASVASDPRLQTPQMVDLAEATARYLLRQHPERIRHTSGVVERAKLLTATVSAREAPLLVAVAWLHDVGYASALRQTRFHPLDGALALRAAGWPGTVCGLVAHHSGARFVATVRGLDDGMAGFSYVEDPLSDAVTVADQTAGPNGVPMTIDERIEDMLSRHGPDSPNARADSQRRPYLLAAGTRVASRLDKAGITPDRHGIFVSRQ